jgi:chaperone BCS1
MELKHPSTFATLAMDEKQKKSIIDDLNMFIKRKDYYARIGKAWKRGYLLYGPPGTGKSSLIAAIANHLKFDIYDLELTGVDSNSDLRRLLVGMTNKSILVVEDIDCTIQMEQREEHGKFNSTETMKEEDKVTLDP